MGWALHVLLALSVPLVADEAYYLAWSQRLGAGYLDHPPGVAWWMALGGGHPRLPGLLLLPVAWWVLADAARRFGAQGWRWVPALLVWTPLGVSATVFVTPDAPLIALWCGVLWAVAARRPALVGLLFGLSLWTKSTALVALPGLLWVLWRRGGWAAAARAGGLAAMVYAPHIGWSLSHNGLPWSFQARRGLSGVHLHEVLGAQLLVVTPGWCVLAVRAWWRARGDDARGDDARALMMLGLPVLVVWSALSLGTRVEANWPALAWPATAILILYRSPERGIWRAFGIGVGFTVVGAVVLVGLTLFAGPELGPPRDPQGLRACYEAASALPKVAARYQEKALLDAAGPPIGYLRARGHRPSQYDLWDTPPAPACGFLYLASVKALGPRCDGVVEGQRACGRAVALCRCVPAW